MSRSKWVLMVGVFAAAALAVGVGPAAANIIFGEVAPTPACQAPAAGFPGGVCGITETFTSGADTIVANGFTGAPAPGTGNTNLTLKTVPPNTFGEGGLGINTTAGPACTDPDCEIVPPQSVTAVSTGRTSITDAIIGSVQAGEFFNFYTQSVAGGAFTLLNATPIGSDCSGPGFSAGPVAETCIWNAPAGQSRTGIAVQGSTAGDILLTEVSTRGVPEPASLMLLGTGLLGYALMRRRQKV